MKIERSNHYREYIRGNRLPVREQETARVRSFIRRSSTGTDQLEISGEAQRRFEKLQEARHRRETRDRERIVEHFERLLERVESLSANRGSEPRAAKETDEEHVLGKTAEILLGHLW